MIKRKAGSSFLIFSFLLILIFTGIVQAQTPTFQVTVDRLFYNQYPQVDTYISVVDAQGFPITNLTKNSFTVRLDGEETDDFQVSPYTYTDEVLAIVLAIDTSGSMDNPDKPTPLDNSVEGAKNFVSQLSDQDLVSLVTFAKVVTMHNDLTTDKRQIASILDTLEPGGATAINDAIVDSIDILKNRSERRAIILLTDGVPDGDQVYTFDQALLHASDFKIPIYPIGFGGVYENQLKRLAGITGGSEQVKPDSVEMSEAFTNILNVFREQYYLKINSDIVADNKEHEVEVIVSYEGGEKNAFHTFIARDPVMIEVTGAESGETLNGTVPITAEVDALNTVTRVDFLVDDEVLHSTTSSPYQVDWDTTQSVTGEHTLKVRAYDDLGFETEETVDILVELQRQDWIFWLIGLIVLIGIALFVSIGLRRKKPAPPAVRNAHLVEIEGRTPGTVWPLSQQITRMGRTAAKNDIPLIKDDLSASREHAVIERDESGYIIRSLKPDNPCVINGNKMESSTLNSSDVIKLGKNKFRFEYED